MCRYLDVGSNALNGSLPSNITQLSALIALDLRHNDLAGPLPNLTALAPRLTGLNLMGNGFNETLPSSLLSLTNLRCVVGYGTLTQPCGGL